MNRKLENFLWRHSEIISGIITIFVILLMVVCVTVPLVFGISYLDEKSCIEKAEMMNVEYDYGLMKGCLWNIDGKWIPENNYVLMEDKDG